MHISFKRANKNKAGSDGKFACDGEPCVCVQRKIHKKAGTRDVSRK